MYQDEFVKRLVSLRVQKGFSARDMSLSIGQNAGYINTIENGKALPSMSAFFYICDYLGITPAEFFETDIRSPEAYGLFLEDVKKLNPEDFELIAGLAKRLAKK